MAFTFIRIEHSVKFNNMKEEVMAKVAYIKNSGAVVGLENLKSDTIQKATENSKLAEQKRKEKSGNFWKI